MLPVATPLRENPPPFRFDRTPPITQESSLMFEKVTAAPPDAILGLTETFKKDPRPGKVNLSVGVFKDDQGRTPVLKCVKEAEPPTARR